MEVGYYKWSYDPRTDELQTWPVSGPESYANPQHGVVIGDEGYAYCSQGRLTLRPNDVPSLGTIYLSRPFMGEAKPIQSAAKVKLEKLVSTSINWINAQ